MSVPSESAIADPAGALSRAFGEPTVSGQIRVECADFAVEELPAFEPDGDGEHLLLKVRKTGENTDWVAQQLARVLGVPGRAVGYAGRKDRRAVATQWFSAHLPGRLPPEGWDRQLPDSVTVQACTRHRRKLRVGALRGNQFRILVRNLQGDLDTLAIRMRHVASEGVPNYFGPQRFGRGGQNIARAAAMFASAAGRPRKRQAGLYLSAARSFLFNEVLTRRVADASWNQLGAGDVAGLDGSNSVFAVGEIDELMRQRVVDLDVHPTGPLWGRGALMSTGSVAALENAVATRHGALARGLEAAGCRQARRPLRLPVRHGMVEIGRNQAWVAFELPAGGFATSVLRELLVWHDAGPTTPNERRQEQNHD